MSDQSVFENRLRRIVYSSGAVEAYQCDYAGELVRYQDTKAIPHTYVYGTGVAPLAETVSGERGEIRRGRGQELGD